MFNGSFAEVTTAGGFVDPTLPAGYAPFGIQQIGGKIYVAYAQAGITADRPQRRRRAPASAWSTCSTCKGNLLTHPGPDRRRAQRAVGPRDGARELRQVLQHAAGRQLRRRQDQRLRSRDRRDAGHDQHQRRRRRSSTPRACGRCSSATDSNNQPTNTLFYTAGPGQDERTACTVAASTSELTSVESGVHERGQVLNFAGSGLESARVFGLRCPGRALREASASPSRTRNVEASTHATFKT